MTAYALAHLRRDDRKPVHADVLEYMERIQSTLDPYRGRFLVHGAQVHVQEGTWAGDLVLIRFPGLVEARAWYESPAYRAIKHLRTDHLDGDVVLVEGVDSSHDPARLAARLRHPAAASRSGG